MKKLLISFSGGRTSAYMLWWVLNEWTDRDNYEIIVVFANTGKEVEGTLEFIERCSKEWGVEIIWVESAPIQSKIGKWWGVTHKIVDFKTASRKGEPFKAMISKLGIPSTNAPFCSDQLKKKAIKSYLRSIGWKGYYTAIGIRYDEPDRVRKDAAKHRVIYPLYEHTVMSKWDILAWWASMPFDLEIEAGSGNCDNCWKKGIKTLIHNMRKRPHSFEWWRDMTDKYGHLNPRNTDLEPPFNFYRGNLSPADLLKLSKMPDEAIAKMASKEKLDACIESCEAF